MYDFIRKGLILGALMILASGCASTQPAPAPTIAPVSVAPTAAPAPSSSSSSAASVSAGNPASGSNVIRLVAVPSKSEARYRVREQLASLSLPSDAIGKTNAISGTIVGKTDGTIVSSDSKFVVDLRTLVSDRSQRDGFLQSNVLQTSRFPNAVFVPTQTQGLNSPVPTSGQATFKLIGDLTIRDVTKPVTWDVTCKGEGNEGTCQATTNFTFEYFNITQPRVPVVLSVVDNIVLELDIDLQRTSN